MDRLREIVGDAMSGRWRVDEGTGSEVFDVVNHANVGILDNGLYEHALFAATFDPVMVSALLDVYEAADEYALHGPQDDSELLDRLREVLAAVDRLTGEDTE